MKKAKIILSAVALFAVVGGALAFKARGLGNVYTFSTSTTTTLNGPIVPICHVVPTLISTTQPGQLSTFYKSTLQRNVCTTLTTTFVTQAPE